MTTFSFRMFLDRFHEYVRHERLIGRDEHILVAVSGGIDSSVLLHLMVEVDLGLKLGIAHVNYGLRGEESDGDEEFVRNLGEKFELPVYVDRPSTKSYAKGRKIGIQEAARELRYGFFERVLKSEGYVSVATAHNADDNAETVILNVLRGAGVQGLSGIPCYREEGAVIRPLLFATRNDIVSYAEACDVPYRVDSSNAKEDYTRNLIRHRILPIVREKINPSVSETLMRSSALFRDLEEYLDNQAEEAAAAALVAKTDNELRLSTEVLSALPAFLCHMVIRTSVREIAGIAPDGTPTRAIAHLMEMQSGHRVTLNARWEVLRDRDALIIHERTPNDPVRAVVTAGEQLTIGTMAFSSENFDGLPPAGEGECVDADTVGEGPLILRSWEEGDSFAPLGMNGMKKLSDFFIDEKVPLHEKQRSVVLTTNDGTIIWVCGFRLDNRFRLTASTKRVLRLQFTRLTDGGHG